MSVASARGAGADTRGLERDRVAAFWRAATAAAGRALTTREARGLWAVHGVGPRPRHLATQVSTLVRRGALVVVAGENGAKYYAVADDALGARVAPATARDVVVGVLHEETLRGGGIAAKRIRERAAAAGLALSDTALRHTLRGLLRSDTVTWKGARWRIVQCPVPLVGAKHRQLWALVPPAARSPRVSPAAENAVRSVRQRVLRTMDAARGLLGMPPTRLEWQLYVEHAAEGGDADAVLLAGRTGYDTLRLALLSNKSAAARAHRSHEGLARGDGASLLERLGDARYAMGAVTEAERATACATDLLTHLQAGVELESIARLREWWRAARAGQPAAQRAALQLADLRERTLAQVLLGELPKEQWAAAVAGAQHALGVLEEWSAARPNARPSLVRRRGRALRRSAGDLTTVADWLASGGLTSAAALAVSGAPVTIVPAGVAEGALLHRMAQDRWSGRAKLPELPWVFRHARPAEGRTPMREAHGAARRRRATLARDRVDAWRELYVNAGCPAAAALIAEADGLLGRVVRDAAVLRNAAAALPEQEQELRAALVVACGLLGVAPSDDDLRRARTSDHARALLLAGYVAAPDAVADLARTAGHRWTARPTIRTVALQALLRIRAGDALRLIEEA